MELFQENDFAMVGRVRLSRADQSHGHAMTPRKLQWQVACASFRNKLQSRVREEEGVATAELPPSRSRSRLLGQLVSFARSGRSSRRCHAAPAPPRPAAAPALTLDTVARHDQGFVADYISCGLRWGRQSSARHATASADQPLRAAEHGRARPTRDLGPVVVVVGVGVGEAEAGARAVAAEPGVVAPAVRQRRRPWPQKRLLLLLLLLEVPVPLHRGVVQLALHRVGVVVHKAEEQGRRAGG